MRARTRPSTYVILDTPLFSCLQWLYLATVLGPSRVHLHETPGEGVREGLVNLVPVSFTSDLRVTADLFISTWALSECSREAQDFVIARRWFGAKRLLLAYQGRSGDFAQAERLGALAAAQGARIVPIGFLPGHHYAFR